MSRFFDLTHLRGDIFGGLTAGVVALPLALAFGGSVDEETAAKIRAVQTGGKEDTGVLTSKAKAQEALKAKIAAREAAEAQIFP